jgi:hypothetical protein
LLAKPPDHDLAHRRAVEGVRIRRGNGKHGFGGPVGHAAVDLGLIQLQEFGPPHGEPRLRIAHRPAFPQHEWVRQRVGAHLGLVVVGDVASRRAAKRVAVGILTRQRGGGGGRRRLVETAPLQERPDVRIGAGEVAEHDQRVLAAAAREDGLAETVAVGADQAAVLLEPLDAVGIEHLGPDVRVIARGVAAFEDVSEIGATVAWRHGGEVDAGPVQGGGFKGHHIVRHFAGFELVPGLVEERRREVFRRRKALVEFPGGQHLLKEGGRHGGAGLVVLRVVLQHVGPGGPHLVHLGRELHKIARDTTVEARIGHVGEHPVQRVAELVKHRCHLVEGQQRRLARRRFGDVEVDGHNRLPPQELGLPDEAARPGPAAL